MSRMFVVGCVVFAAVELSSCVASGDQTADADTEADMPAAATELAGECAAVYGGQVCSWATESNGQVTEVGLTVPLTSIEGAPAEDMPVWPPQPIAVLNLPADAQAATGLRDVTMYWEAHGHPPGAYLTPHFDFHFNQISEADRMAIDCSDLSKPAALPAAFGLPDVDLPPEMAEMTGTAMLTGLCVPQMGMHAALQSELESTEPFDGTMVVGYYAGEPIFLEPMISRAMLERKQSFDLGMPEVPGLMGPQPMSFHAAYDATANAYRFTFSGFTPTG